MTDEEFAARVKDLMLRVRTAEAEAAEQVLRKARAEAEAAEHILQYQRDYYKLPPGRRGQAS